MKKQSFILTEVLVVILILGFVTPLLFGIFSNFSKNQALMQQIEERENRERMAVNRIKQVLSNVTFKEKSKNDTANPYVFSSEKREHDYSSLLFTFNNGVDTDVEFSNDVYALLSVNSNKELVLTTWPFVKNIAHIPDFSREELLLENVSKFEISCFAGNPQKWNKNNDLLPARAKALSEWKAAYQQIPIVVSMNIVFEDSKSRPPLSLWCLLPNSLYPLSLDSGG